MAALLHLISNISQWLDIDPYELLSASFGGSGYDIACARADGAITYQRKALSQPIIEDTPLNWPFKDSLYFVYLNQKQNSRIGIKRYQEKGSLNEQSRNTLNKISKTIIDCSTLSEFISHLQQHDTIISELLDLPTVQKEHFEDFNGYTKSLGAWGGDFILVCSETNPTSYFKSKGYHTIIPLRI